MYLFTYESVQSLLQGLYTNIWKALISGMPLCIQFPKNWACNMLALPLDGDRGSSAWGAALKTGVFHSTSKSFENTFKFLTYFKNHNLKHCNYC